MYTNNTEHREFIELSSYQTSDLLLEFYVIGSRDCHVHLSSVVNPNRTNYGVYDFCKWKRKIHFFFLFPFVCLFDLLFVCNFMCGGTGTFRFVARFVHVFAAQKSTFLHMCFLNCICMLFTFSNCRFQWLGVLITHAPLLDTDREYYDNFKRQTYYRRVSRFNSVSKSFQVSTKLR